MRMDRCQPSADGELDALGVECRHESPNLL
jgi:hypothetical protein